MLSHSFDPKQHPEQLDVAGRDILSGRPGDGILHYALMNKVSDDDSNMQIVEFGSGQELISWFLGAEASLPFPEGGQGRGKNLQSGYFVLYRWMIQRIRRGSEIWLFMQFF